MKNFHALFLPALLLVALPAWADTQQKQAELRAVVESFVRTQTSSLAGQVTMKVGEIDRRIKLPVCPEFEAFLPPGGKLLGNGTVGVRCPAGKKDWKLFVSVHVTVIGNMLITGKPLQQGQVLRAEDLASQSGELTQTGILTDPAQAVGKILKYNTGTGQVLKQDMLRAPYAVTQGQTVQLRVEGAGFKIHSEGQALNNAAEGQAVRVRTSHDQVVSGMAIAGGIVEVRP